MNYFTRLRFAAEPRRKEVMTNTPNPANERQPLPMSFPVGTAVWHPDYGYGVAMESSDRGPVIICGFGASIAGVHIGEMRMGR